MTTEFQQQLAGGLCNPESLKAFGQMYNNPAYGGGFFKDEKQYPMFPFLAQHFAPYSAPATSAFSPSSSSTSSNSSAHNNNNNNIPSKKKPVPVPAEQKDESYYERRRRNNEAAKKSREQRRKQDTDNEFRVRTLAEENAQLRMTIYNLNVENDWLKQRVAQLFPQLSASIGAIDGANAANVPQY